MKASAKIYKSPLWLRYAIPIVAVGIAIIFRIAMIDWFEGRYPLILFVIPVIIAAWYGGPGPALLAGVLGVIAGASLLKPFNLQIGTTGGLERVTIFSVVSFICVFFVTRLHVARHRAEVNELKLQNEIQEREKIEQDLRREMYTRLHTETALGEALARAEKASQAKTEFLAHMSHEIRTPMNAVLGIANILLMTGPLTERQKEFIATLKLSGDALLTLINDMLDIAKIEASSVELETIPFNLCRLAEEVMSIMALKAWEKKLEFTIETGNFPVAEYNGDPTRIRQIMINLCSNAIKFTSAGKVAIILESTPVDAATDTVYIRVKDTGIGIHADMLANIFEKFIQGDSAINRKYGGSGLGLAITKNLVEIMGGAISVVSDDGNGSTFTVQLPLRKSESLPSALADGGLHSVEDAKNIGIKKRVLLVEDHAPNVLVAGSFLELFGFDYDVAHDGSEALKKFEAEDYFAALMDVQMPGLDGFETTRRIRALERSSGRRHMPIIGMTAHAMAHDRDLCLESGMEDYIAKPFNPDDLEGKLKSLGANENNAVPIKAVAAEA